MRNLTIWKYTLRLYEKIEKINMPKDSEILCAKPVGDFIRLWVKVDADKHNDQEIRNFYLVGTGDALPEGNLLYIDTMVDDEGSAVQHLFEIVE